MKRSINTNSGQASGEQVQKKGGGMKITIVGITGQVIGILELRPRTFRSRKKGYWSSTKIIDWDAQKQYQFNAYAVEIASGSKAKNEPTAESGNNLSNQLSLPEEKSN